MGMTLLRVVPTSTAGAQGLMIAQRKTERHCSPWKRSRAVICRRWRRTSSSPGYFREHSCVEAQMCPSSYSRRRSRFSWNWCVTSMATTCRKRFLRLLPQTSLNVSSTCSRNTSGILRKMRMAQELYRKSWSRQSIGVK